MGTCLAIAQRCAQRYCPMAWFGCRSNSRLTNDHAPRMIGDRFSGRPNERPMTCCSAVSRARLASPPQRTNHDSSATIHISGRQSGHRRICQFASQATTLKAGTASRTDPRTAAKGRTYREVAQLFQERLGLYVAPSTLHSFVKVRAKHRKRTQFELPPLELAVAESPVLDRVAALKAKPTVRTAKPARFVFRENEPLTLTSNGGEQ